MGVWAMAGGSSRIWAGDDHPAPAIWPDLAADHMAVSHGGITWRFWPRRMQTLAWAWVDRRRRDAWPMTRSRHAAPPSQPYGTSTMEPVVLRASRSRCACAASLRG